MHAARALLSQYLQRALGHVGQGCYWTVVVAGTQLRSAVNCVHVVLVGATAGVGCLECAGRCGRQQPRAIQRQPTHPTAVGGPQVRTAQLQHVSVVCMTYMSAFTDAWYALAMSSGEKNECPWSGKTAMVSFSPSVSLYQQHPPRLSTGHTCCHQTGRPLLSTVT
jgi:hypothetical protein